MLVVIGCFGYGSIRDVEVGIGGGVVLSWYDLARSFVSYKGE